MERHGLERVLIRNLFYVENYRRIGLIFVLLCILILALAGFVFYQRLVWPKPQYFATTPDGRPILVIRLDIPIYQDPNFVLNWASNAVKAIYSLDYVTWRTTLQNAEVYFTQKGYHDFLAALKASTNLEAIKAKRQVVSLDITAPPTVSRQGQLTPELPYSWDLQMQVTVTYQNSEQEMLKQIGTLLLRVERASLLRHQEGLAISQLVLQAQ